MILCCMFNFFFFLRYEFLLLCGNCIHCANVVEHSFIGIVTFILYTIQYYTIRLITFSLNFFFVFFFVRLVACCHLLSYHFSPDSNHFTDNQFSLENIVENKSIINVRWGEKHFTSVIICWKPIEK